MEKIVNARINKFDLLWLFYQILLAFLFCIFWPFFIHRIRKGLKERLGFLPKMGSTLFFPKKGVLNEKARRARDGNIIWGHAASVGEVVAMGNLIRAFKSKWSDYNFVVSTLTSTGQSMARKVIPDGQAYIYFPLDFSCIVGRVLDTIKPKLLIIAETELWPNFIREAKKRAIPIMVANGRISASSFRKYKMVKFFMKRILENIDLFAMQTQMDAERIISLGAHASKVAVTGNIKFDVGSDFSFQPANSNSRSDRIFFTAGSTHRGEEETILDVYREVKKLHPDVVLILAPRHPQRVTEVERLLVSRNLRFARRTDLPFPFQDNSLSQIILVDTIGELTHFYALAKIVFVGGSLVPAGGHNILEPAILGKGVLFGPYMDNFGEIAQSFISRGAGRVVSNRQELLDSILELLSHPEKLKKMGRIALEIVETHKGAADRSAVLAKDLLSHNDKIKVSQGEKEKKEQIQEEI